MAGQNRYGTNLFTWIAFAVAATMILILASSTMNYSPSNAPVTSFDQIGGVLPYTLVATLVSYYLLKSRLRGMLSSQIRSSFKVLGMALLVGGGVLLVAMLVIIFSIPFPLTASGPGQRSRPITLTGENSFNLPVFDLLSLPAIFMIAFPIVAILLAAYLRRKTEIVEEPIEEMTGPQETWNGAPENTYDEYRKAIIANYVVGRELMVHRGVPSSDISTPREFESSVVESVNDARKDFVPLTRLFEEARFSAHPMSEPEKAKAEKHRRKLENLSPNPRGN